MNLNKDILYKICCPICKSKLKLIDNEFNCLNILCNATFPLINGIPILINESNSIFTINDYVQQREIYFSKESRIKTLFRWMLPEISLNIKGEKNYNKFAEILLQKTNNLKVLVIGGGILGKGMEALLKTDITLVDSDVSFAPRTQIILDSHDIPFEDETFDGVIAQAVLEHVIDPYRCTEEIHRVLKKDGLIYAEIPFIEQVHGREYDFTRFTHTGMRRLLRRFTEISSGACYGPGVALAWSIRSFFLSFTTNKILRSSINLFARLTLFWIKYLDYYLIDKPGTLDSASCYYFMGKKSNLIVSDQEIVKRYQGAG